MHGYCIKSESHIKSESYIKSNSRWYTKSHISTIYRVSARIGMPRSWVRSFFLETPTLADQLRTGMPAPLTGRPAMGEASSASPGVSTSSDVTTHALAHQLEPLPHMLVRLLDAREMGKCYLLLRSSRYMLTDSTQRCSAIIMERRRWDLWPREISRDHMDEESITGTRCGPNCHDDRLDDHRQLCRVYCWCLSSNSL